MDHQALGEVVIVIPATPTHQRQQLLVDGLENLNLHLASRNRPGITMLDAGSVNAYEVLNHRWIVASAFSTGSCRRSPYVHSESTMSASGRLSPAPSPPRSARMPEA